VHRLDKETSGLLLLAKKRSALLALQAQLRERGSRALDGEVVRRAGGGSLARQPESDRRALHKFLDSAGERRVRTVDDEHVDGRRSITLVRVARRLRDWTLLDVTLKTGRTHQIRVHLADAGHVIAGDDKYGDRVLNRSLARGIAVPEARFERMFLHAKGLRFAHPASGETVALEAPLPAACARLLDALPAASTPST
jgi:23S rRNA pseudouridine955/2504/2580 synthase